MIYTLIYITFKKGLRLFRINYLLISLT